MTAICGGLAIVLGAFGAHGLKEILTEEMLTIFETGVKYHFYHALAMLGLIAYAKHDVIPTSMKYICLCWLFGILIFSGSLYILSVTSIRWLGAITPIGGVLMIIGWFWLAFSAKKITCESTNNA
jgi:uncharacterized membrane protein YgdD (TMEM256/DUF423 family)